MRPTGLSGVLLLLLKLALGKLTGPDREEAKRYLKYVLAGLVIFILSVAGISYSAKSQDTSVIYLTGLLAFASFLFIFHKYYTGKGGEYSNSLLDKRTVKLINILKGFGFNSLTTALLGVFISSISVVYGWYFNDGGIVVSLSGILFIFGIYLIFVSDIWRKNKDKF